MWWYKKNEHENNRRLSFWFQTGLEDDLNGSVKFIFVCPLSENNFTADLVTLTEEILNGKLYFLSNAY